MNMWLVGIFVLFIHDLSDFILIIGRGYRDYKHYNKIVIRSFYFVGFIGWIGCRIVLLSYCCVYASLSSAYRLFVYKDEFPEHIYNVMIIPGSFMGFMLSALLVLQIFWTYFIIKGFA